MVFNIKTSVKDPDFKAPVNILPNNLSTSSTFPAVDVPKFGLIIAKIVPMIRPVTILLTSPI